jgi:hypothetical protein
VCFDDGEMEGIPVVYVWSRWSLRLIVSSSLAFRFDASGGLTDPAHSHFETLHNAMDIGFWNPLVTHV